MRVVCLLVRVSAYACCLFLLRSCLFCVVGVFVFLVVCVVLPVIAGFFKHMLLSLRASVCCDSFVVFSVCVAFCWLLCCVSV